MCPAALWRKRAERFHIQNCSLDNKCLYTHFVLSHCILMTLKALENEYGKYVLKRESKQLICREWHKSKIVSILWSTGEEKLKYRSGSVN